MSSLYGLVNIYCLGQALRSKYFSHYLLFASQASSSDHLHHSERLPGIPLFSTKRFWLFQELASAMFPRASEFDAIRDRSHDGNKP